MGKFTIRDLSQQRLKEILSYSQETGGWTWLISPTNTVKIGNIAGCINPRGYRMIAVDGKRYLSSRLVFLYMEGYFPECEVDHVDRVRDNDKWSNLRESTRQCNLRNRGIMGNNKSGVTGVYWDVKRKKWLANIKVSSKLINLGRFGVFKDAVKARWDAEKKHNWPNCCSCSSSYLYLKKGGAI